MQYKWREDLLLEEKQAWIQEKTDHLLGKLASALNVPTAVPVENPMILPPHIL
jgi:hypothetical protein